MDKRDKTMQQHTKTFTVATKPGTAWGEVCQQAELVAQNFAAMHMTGIYDWRSTNTADLKSVVFECTAESFAN
jgi:hypothetical protein